MMRGLVKGHGLQMNDVVQPARHCNRCGRVYADVSLYTYHVKNVLLNTLSLVVPASPVVTRAPTMV